MKQKNSFFFFCCHTWSWTQGLDHVRKVIYQLNYITRPPFTSYLFWVTVLLSYPGWLWMLSVAQVGLELKIFLLQPPKQLKLQVCTTTLGYKSCLEESQQTQQFLSSELRVLVIYLIMSLWLQANVQQLLTFLMTLRKSSLSIKHLWRYYIEITHLLLRVFLSCILLPGIIFNFKS